MGKTKRNRPDREREWAGRLKYKDDLETERERIDRVVGKCLELEKGKQDF